MSADIIDLPARPGARADGLRPAIRDLLGRMARHLGKTPGFEAVPDGFSFDCRVGRTSVAFRSADLPLPDRHRVTEVAEVRTDLRDALQDISPAEMAWFNRYASLGALLRDPATGLPFLPHGVLDRPYAPVPHDVWPIPDNPRLEIVRESVFRHGGRIAELSGLAHAMSPSEPIV